MNVLTNHATRTAVSVTGLRKAYGEKVVLDGVALTIGEGEVFALLGPNGAGKTTIVRILSTLIPADAGTATVMGFDLRRDAGAVRGVIGVTGQFSAVDDLLSGEENLLLMGRLLHLPADGRRARAVELLERFDLVEAARQTPATYSGGMKRRLDLAMTLMGRPRLIFLDEPTTGLDPRSRHTMWQIIRELVGEGVTIAAHDSATMLGREIKHSIRLLRLLIVSAIVVPVVMLLLFDYILGGTIGHGLGDAARGAPYVDFLVPGILIMAVAGSCGPTAINVTMDMTGGFVDRIRTMAVSRGALLAGHVGGSLLRMLVATAAVTGVALLVGFRPTASVADWFAVVGIVAAFSFALAWLSAAIGLMTRSVAAANGLTLPLSFLLPFLSSTFVPTATMPAGVRWFAEHQPFTLVVDSLRALLTGAPVGNTPYVALAWCAAIALVSYLWAQAAFRRGTRLT